jgi:BioD-like phosphotransacetylase family protein
MSTLLIVSTTPGAGKTAVACWMASRLASCGRRPGLFRAFARVGSAFGTGRDPDSQAMAKLVPEAVGLEPARSQSTFPQFPEVTDAARSIGRLTGQASPVLVEGLSGAPELNRRLAEELGAQILLVTGWGDDPVPTATALGPRLIGVLYNGLPRYRQHELNTRAVPALAAARIPYLGAIPDDRRLLAVTVGQLAEHLGGEFVLWKEKADELVDYFLIGGNVWDWGVHYFSVRENAAAVIRGDRPDMQMAALATSIKALVLTAGKPPLPIQYVQYEADQEEVPLIVAPHDTHKTAALLETIQDRARFDHPGKLLRMKELADAAVDFGTIESALAQPAIR